MVFAAESSSGSTYPHYLQQRESLALKAFTSEISCDLDVCPYANGKHFVLGVRLCLR